MLSFLKLIPLWFGLIQTVLTTKISEIPCSHKYIECGPVSAICGCSETDFMMNCVTADFCMCDETQRFYEVDYETAQSVGGYDLTSGCEVRTGNIIYYNYYYY